MSKYQNILADKNNQIKTLRYIIVGLFLVCLFLIFGWSRAPSKLKVYIPPDLRSETMRPWWEVPPSTVYGFTYYVFQQIHRWPSNGEVDYINNIERFKNYLTPNCQVYLNNDYKNRKNYGELTDRERGVFEIPGRGYNSNKVKIIDKDNWIVTLDLNIDEHYKDEPVKRTLTRFPLKVVRFSADQETNPWGLMLDCYAETPKKLELEKKPAE